MANYNSLKDKLLIVADHDQQNAQKITKLLSDNGFLNVRVAEDGSKIYEILRSCYSNPEQIGLVIVNEDLPQCQLREMCQSLSCATDESIVPFIILSKTQNDPRNFCDPNDGSESHSRCLLSVIQQPLNERELLMVVDFQLAMKYERFLRHKQEERLINELAERKVVDSKLKYLVAHDELTGLFNRNNFERQLRLILNRGRDLRQESALLFIDVDRFSMINELEGFEVGDRLLVELVVMIRKFVSPSILFARIGSDEFCLFIENKTEAQALGYAEKIKKAVEEFRFFTGEVCYSISISIGITTLNASSAVYHPSELILQARQACNTAKENGRNLIWQFNENDVAVQERRRDIFWVPLIKKALMDKELFLVYQPVVDINSGEISHFEALIRMKDEEGAVISPAQFIPVAERMGLIHNIDLWVCETAIDFLAALPAGMEHVSLAINLSSTAFQDAALLPTIKDKLELTWVDAKRLTFEITETAAVENFEKTRHMIDKIRALGCKFALDDFGAGFCSFNYLKSFPVDYVKIDGQFIQNLILDETDQILVKSMAEIAKQLGKKTIAEYVETPSVMKKLQEIGIDLGQGYLFGKPTSDIMKVSRIPIMNLLNSPSLEGMDIAH